MTPLSQKTLRSQIANKRKELSPEEVIKKSREAAARFLSLFNWKKTEGAEFYVGFYRPLPFELNLAELELEFKKRGCHLAFPRMGAPVKSPAASPGESPVALNDETDHSMEFLEVPDVHSPTHWRLGKYGVQEPNFSLPKIAPEKLNLIFVPGVAFGQSGARIGRGAGYYDRYLIRGPQALRVALGFDLQFVESGFETQSWDQQIDYLVTESREFCFVRANQKEDWMRK